MRLLYLNEFFWPDNAGRLIRPLGQAWAAAGHDVTVLTMQPHYRSYRGPRKVAPTEIVAGVSVRRMRAVRWPLPPKASTVLNGVCFLFQAAFHGLRRKRPDIVISGTMPPIVCAFVGYSLARMTGARYVYHCQDIYPEAEEVLQRSIGRPSGGRWRALTFRWMKALDSWVMRRADAVVALSSDMVGTLADRGVSADRITIINNLFMADERSIEPPARSGPHSPIRLLFAGNVGRFQKLDALVRALGELPDDVRIELLILGDGIAKASLMELAARLCPGKVHFHDPVPMADVGRFIDDADYCVVSLETGIVEVAYPSKVMAYVGRGAPLLCVVEPDSELGRLVVDRELGVVVQPGDAEKLLHALRELAAGPEKVAERSAAAGRVAAELFSPAVIAGQWLTLLSRLGRRQSALRNV